MDYKNIFSVAAGILFAIGFLPYIRAILRGDAKPAKASWIIWASLDVITITGMFVEKTINGLIVAAVIFASATAILSIKKGIPDWTKTDKICILLAVLAIALWKTFNDPTLAIITCLTAMIIGAIPTYTSIWNHPERENRTAWTFFWISCVAAIIGIKSWTLTGAAQPFTFFAIESVTMWLLWIRPQLVKH